MLSLMRNCAAMGQSRAALALANRLLGVDPKHDEARRVRDDAERAQARGPAVGRNDPCPCGSGKRYKACHGAFAASAPAASPARSDDPDTLTRAGIEAHRAGRLDEAERAYHAALAGAPDHPYAGHYLGVIEMQRRDYRSAIPRLERAAAARPGEPDFHMNLGLAYSGVDRFDDAIGAHRRSIAIDPRKAGPWNNLGLALTETSRHAEAADAFRRAIDIDPSIPKVRWNLAMTRLMLGDRGGWEDYESRLDIEELGAGGDLAHLPRYRGGELAGKTLLLDAEQGYGDILQCARFVAVLAARGAKVILRLPSPIANLMRTVPGVAGIVPLGAKPPVDAWLPLMSVPGVLGAHPHGDAPDPPYVFADPARVDAMRAKLREVPARAHIGLSWAGNPRQENNRRRSCPLARLAPLLEREGIAWYSLQRVDGEDQIASVPAARALRLPDERNDFDGKAALMGALDLVISVCTSNAHLAGALGRPAWVMLAYAPDWRWGTSGTSSAWYPSARLFRQPAPGDWDSVVRDVGRALDAWMTAR
jgi:tetratricopeptide (TPR) repeat protein